ncbi:MBL fold metallo-hydrolase [Cedecea sp. NFIX57]|uniref:MBL fold metallo-hydrolase n=1 Tax=Cedecea sp. NFIX57 TaxID=1566286 RepID=UPI000A09BAE4|nr:ribonuclease Z [Cedecea sp. NFIX57]SMG30011.1 Ribonuclease BN, tRNA processing enzyme [Cedecea sp. NFIX57]
MKIDVLGCGSAFSRWQNTSALRIVDDENRQWLIDCGPTVPRALWQRGGGINDIDVLFFTHVHPDHCTGLTALLNHWKSFGRQKPLVIYSQPEQREVLMQLASLANWPEPSLCFPIEWRDSEADFHWHHWRVRTAPTRHEMPNLALRVDIREYALFYSGDGRPTEDSIALMAGVDLAFQECASLSELAEDASHGDFPGCLKLFTSLGLPSLGLYHCNDAILPALKLACRPYAGLFVSHDGLQYDFHQQRFYTEDYLP